MYVCYPCDEMVAWEKSNLCSSHLLVHILIWSQSLSYYPQLIDEYWTVGWALPPSYAPSSPDRLELDGWGTMWAGLDEAVLGWEWENNPGRHMDLLLRDMGRETPTVVLHARLPGQGRSASVLQRVSWMRVWWSQRGKKTDAAVLLLLFIATCQVGLGWKCWDIRWKWRDMLLEDTTSLGVYIL